MPRPTLPPTPTSSSELKPLETIHDSELSTFQFQLPPSAYNDTARPQSASSTTNSSESSYTPNPAPRQPTSSRKRPIAPTPITSVPKPTSKKQSLQPSGAFSLPPAPTLPRKIIQMKPKQSVPNTPNTASTSTTTTRKAAPPTAPKTKPSSTSAASRKTARKTAHSLIERRRRLKMNEEFGVLKSLIPACEGEMHKLAILQASIDYVRYLEECVRSLKVQNENDGSSRKRIKIPDPPCARSNNYENVEDEYEQGNDEDVDMDTEIMDSFNPAPVTHVGRRNTFTSTSTPVSPVILPENSISNLPAQAPQTLTNERSDSPPHAMASPQCTSGHDYTSQASSPRFANPLFTAEGYEYTYTSSVSNISTSSTNITNTHIPFPTKTDTNNIINPQALYPTPPLNPTPLNEQDVTALALLMLGAADRRGTMTRTCPSSPPFPTLLPLTSTNGHENLNVKMKSHINTEDRKRGMSVQDLLA